jgi:hypothetical protein
MAACPDSVPYFIHVPPNFFVPRLNAGSVPDAAFRLPRIPAECYCSRRFLAIWGMSVERERMAKPLGKPRSRLIQPGAAVVLALLLVGPLHPAAAFTDTEAHGIFDMLDPDHHGKVTKIEFQVNKMNAFYFRFRPRKNASSDMKPLTFEEMRVSREFFDKADQGRQGHLDGVDINDAIHFEDIDTTRRGYFDFGDLAVFLKKIGR